MPHPLGRHERDLARRLRMRDIEDANSGRVLAALQEISRRSRVVGLRIDLHRPHARPVDGKQQVVMGLEVGGAGVGRAVGGKALRRQRKKSSMAQILCPGGTRIESTQRGILRLSTLILKAGLNDCSTPITSCSSGMDRSGSTIRNRA